MSIAESTINARCESSDELTELSAPGTSSVLLVLSILGMLYAPRESKLGRKRKTKVNPPHGKRATQDRVGGVIRRQQVQQIESRSIPMNL